MRRLTVGEEALLVELQHSVGSLQKLVQALAGDGRKQQHFSARFGGELLLDLGGAGSSALLIATISGRSARPWPYCSSSLRIAR